MTWLWGSLKPMFIALTNKATWMWTAYFAVGIVVAYWFVNMPIGGEPALADAARPEESFFVGFTFLILIMVWPFILLGVAIAGLGQVVSA